MSELSARDRAIQRLAAFLHDRGEAAYFMGRRHFDEKEGTKGFTLESLTELLDMEIPKES